MAVLDVIRLGYIPLEPSNVRSNFVSILRRHNFEPREEPFEGFCTKLFVVGRVGEVGRTGMMDDGQQRTTGILGELG